MKAAFGPLNNPTPPPFKPRRIAPGARPSSTLFPSTSKQIAVSALPTATGRPPSSPSFRPPSRSPRVLQHHLGDVETHMATAAPPHLPAIPLAAPTAIVAQDHALPQIIAERPRLVLLVRPTIRRPCPLPRPVAIVLAPTYPAARPVAPPRVFHRFRAFSDAQSQPASPPSWQISENQARQSTAAPARGSSHWSPRRQSNLQSLTLRSRVHRDNHLRLDRHTPHLGTLPALPDPMIRHLRRSPRIKGVSPIKTRAIPIIHQSPQSPQSPKTKGRTIGDRLGHPKNALSRALVTRSLCTLTALRSSGELAWLASPTA